MQRIQQATGLLLNRSSAEARYEGSCFSFRRPDVFLTAFHCVPDVPEGALWIGMPVLGNARQGTLQVTKVIPHPKADVALLMVEGASPEPWYCMSNVDFAAGWGEHVVAFGYPNDTQRDEVLPTARMSLGNVQRFFDYDDRRGTYRAVELSFPAPQGLSGSPISRTQDTGAVIGIITSNHTALTYRGGFEVADPAGNYRATERDVIRYGIGAYLPDLAEWLDEHVPRGIG